MSLKPSELSIPELTKSVVKAAFPKDNHLTMRDELGTIFKDETFSELFAVRGQPAYSPARLALELNDSGFDASILPEFRNRLVEGGLEEHLLNDMLELLSDLGLKLKVNNELTLRMFCH